MPVPANAKPEQVVPVVGERSVMRVIRWLSRMIEGVTAGCVLDAEIRVVANAEVVRPRLREVEAGCVEIVTFHRISWWGLPCCYAWVGYHLPCRRRLPGDLLATIERFSVWE